MPWGRSRTSAADSLSLPAASMRARAPPRSPPRSAQRSIASPESSPKSLDTGAYLPSAVRAGAAVRWGSESLQPRAERTASDRLLDPGAAAAG